VKCIHVGHINNASDGMLIGPIACSVGTDKYHALCLFDSEKIVNVTTW